MKLKPTGPAQLVEDLKGVKMSNRKDYIVGRHVFGNLYDVNPLKLWDEKLLRDLVVKASKAGNMKLLEVKSWRVEGHHGGVSVIALVVESHIALHTWPEHRYATVDVYTCGANSDPFKAFKIIVDELKPSRVVAYYADRSSEPEEIDLTKIKDLFKKPIRIL